MRVAYVINDAAFFVSHRLPLALKVLESGGKVCLITGINIDFERERFAIKKLKEHKISHYECKFSQSFKNPILEFIGIIQLIFHLKKFRPSTIHSATAKCNLLSIQNVLPPPRNWKVG